MATKRNDDVVVGSRKYFVLLLLINFVFIFQNLLAPCRLEHFWPLSHSGFFCRFRLVLQVLL